MIIRHQHGMGGPTTAFGAGAALTSFVLGVAFLVAFQMLEEKPRGKVWIDGAWRSPDYPRRSRDFGVRPQRRRKRS